MIKIHDAITAAFTLSSKPLLSLRKDGVSMTVTGSAATTPKYNSLAYSCHAGQGPQPNCLV
jgi:hypothetical protein